LVISVQALAARHIVQAFGRDTFLLSSMGSLAVAGIADHHPILVETMKFPLGASVAHDETILPPLHWETGVYLGGVQRGRSRRVSSLGAPGLSVDAWDGLGDNEQGGRWPVDLKERRQGESILGISLREVRS
jgi:hypothetical protein